MCYELNLTHLSSVEESSPSDDPADEGVEVDGFEEHEEEAGAEEEVDRDWKNTTKSLEIKVEFIF